MLCSHANPWPERQGNRYRQMMLYSYPDDVVQLHGFVRKSGHAASDLSVRVYGMKEFEVLDPSGHVLIFGQESDDPPTPESR